MQFGIGLPNLSYVDPTQTLISLADAARDFQFESMWVSDHVFIPYELEPNYPYSATGQLGLAATDHLFDPLTTLSYLAGRVDRTSRVTSIFAVTMGLRYGMIKTLMPRRGPSTRPAKYDKVVSGSKR